MTSVWPFRYFVAEWMTRSAPCSSGRKFTGEANVESTSSASPSSLQMPATGSRSMTRINGLVGVSRNTARVVLRIAFFQVRDCVGFTNETSMPSFPNSSRNSRCTPPSSRRAPWGRREWRAWTVPGGGVSRRGETDGASWIACRQPPLDQLIEQRRSRLAGAQALEDAVGALAQHRQSGAGEHGLDGLTMGIGEPAQQQHLHLVADQLRDDLVGARIIETADAGEIHHRDGTRGKIPLDVFPHCSAGRARHQVGVKTGDRLLENGMHHDVWNHHFFDDPFSDSCSGMMSRTCDPGNSGNPSFSGTSSSQRGTIAMRAVPLRMATLPSQRAR